MVYSWDACPTDVKSWVENVRMEIKHIVQENFVGFYLHGSLAMGGFHPEQSDIDVLVVTKEAMDFETKKKLILLFLSYSNKPYPLEISFLIKSELQTWHHPCSYDLHYSEFWRESYTHDVNLDTSDYLSKLTLTDRDLAAHIVITKERGICLEGEAIQTVFPHIPRKDYLDSIMADFQDCLVKIIEDPRYSILNMLRVYIYLKKGVVASKQEAGKWGMDVLPQPLANTVKKVMLRKHGTKLNNEELIQIKTYLHSQVQAYIHECDYINNTIVKGATSDD
ncbi:MULTISPECIES: aminoglycoside adenylyltransferase domain-containing protein [unclassified Virgibacillus]|uniref:aminoglycoside adenylyltransferase domain-containing protein n=1 Tax=unclassified Virgibacillus TaxID=2620237 RepID=UPI0024DEB0E6|nr:aminoglycoside adenylyltransferase domain-containing protein [Virgibacillus sp. LDC-1]